MGRRKTYSGQQTSAVALDSNQSKDGGGIVIESVGAGELMEKKEHDGQEEAAAVACIKKDVLGDGQQAVSLGRLLLVEKLCLHLAILDLDVGVVGVELAQLGKVLHGLLRLAMVQEVTGRLGHKGDHEDHEAGRDDLDGHRRLPLPVFASVDLPQADAIVDPERQSDTGDNHQVVCCGERAAD